MMSRIRYKIKKIILKFNILTKSKYSEQKLKSMSKTRRKFEGLKAFLSSPIKSFKIFKGKTLCIEYLELVLTTYCTLNCKGCSALMEHYKNRKHTDVKMIIKALKKILDSVDFVLHLRLLGGEPLCYLELYDILSYVNKQEKIKRVTIVTNGTLLIKDSKTLEILKNNKFDIYISNYGEYSFKKDKLIEQLKECGIKYFLSNPNNIWRDYGDLECRNRSKKELRKQFYKCKIMCNSLYEGKLHHCPRSSHGMNLGLIPLKQCDYIDLLDEKITCKQLRKKLYKFLYKYVPYVEACNYCNSGTNELKIIKAGVQCKKTI